MDHNILLFIPMYRCERQIGRVLESLKPGYEAYFREVLVVDNRSGDGSLAAAQEAQARIPHMAVKIVENVENYSLGGSHKVAFNYALEEGFEHVVVLHGDDQGSIDDLLPHLQDGSYRETENLLGSRFSRGSTLVGYARFRIFGNWVLNALCSLATGRWVADMGAGLNLYDRRFLQDRGYLAFPDDLTFNVYLLFFAFWKKSSVRFFPLTWREEDQVSNARLFAQSRRIFGLALRYRLAPSGLFGKTESERPKRAYCFTVKSAT